MIPRWEQRGNRHFLRDGDWEYMVGEHKSGDWARFVRHVGDSVWAFVGYFPTAEDARGDG